MAIQTTQDAFAAQLADIYDAEHRFLKGQQEMLQKATNPQVQTLLQEHIGQTQQQIQNLDQVFSALGMQPKGETCEAAKGLVSEAKKDMEDAGTDTLCDVFIGAAALRVEHYEIAAYRAIIPGAQLMGQIQVVNLLQQNLQQEEQTAQKIEQSTPSLLQTAMQAEGTSAKGSASAMGAQATVGTAATAGMSGAQAMGSTSGLSSSGAAGRATGNDFVKVDNTNAQDILVDDTGSTGTIDRQ